MREEFASRLQAGESPDSVFREIELFYVIRQAFDNSDPGRVNYTPDEYDYEAELLLNYFGEFAEKGRPVTEKEFTDHCVSWLKTHFNLFEETRPRLFVSEFLQKMSFWPDEKLFVKGKSLKFDLA